MTAKEVFEVFDTNCLFRYTLGVFCLHKKNLNKKCSFQICPRLDKYKYRRK